MIPLFLEKIYFHTILKNPQYLDVATQNFFSDNVLQKVFTTAKEFTKKYNSIPSRTQLWDALKIKGIDFEQPVIDVIYDIELSDYEEDWLKSNTEAWLSYKSLEIKTKEMIAYISNQEFTPENTRELCLHAVNIVDSVKAIDFNFKEGVDFFDIANHNTTESEKISSGYPFIDSSSGGGFERKSFNVFAGAPKTGKSMWLINLAKKQILQGNNTVYITLELSESIITKRLGSNLFDIDISQYGDFAKDAAQLKQKFKMLQFSSTKPLGKFFIKRYPASDATVYDIEKYILKLEQAKGIKFTSIVIDYVNLIKNQRTKTSDNLYINIKHISEDLRAMATRNDWVIISATQINRTDINSTDMSMTSVSESMGLVHTVDTLYGIIQDALMHANNEYVLKALAIRDGSGLNQKKKFIVDYKKAKIEEDISSEITESFY